MKKKKVTIYDIASKLNISPGTVSRVLNNSTLIGKEKRDLILYTAKEMGYKKRRIKKQVNRVLLNIRLFLPLAEYQYIHLFYDVAELIQGITEGFGNARINIISSINNNDITLFNSKKPGDIDGAIFAFTLPDGEIKKILEEREIPYILINRESPADNYIAVDDTEGMYKLVEKITNRKSDIRICFIGFKQLSLISVQRENAISDALHHKEIEFSSKDVINISSLNEISSALLSSISEKYNTVMCFNDVVAASFYHRSIRDGFGIPNTFSLTGFDNSPVLDILDTRIDTINFSVRNLGKEAGRWLRDWIINRTHGSIRKKISGEYIKGNTI